MALWFLTWAGKGHSDQAHEDTLYQTWTMKHGVLFLALFLLSYLFTFCLVKASLNQPRQHLVQHCCEPVTNETAQSSALNSSVLLQVCQTLQWLIRACTVLQLLQLLL